MIDVVISIAGLVTALHLLRHGRSSSSASAQCMCDYDDYEVNDDGQEQEQDSNDDRTSLYVEWHELKEWQSLPAVFHEVRLGGGEDDVSLERMGEVNELLARSPSVMGCTIRFAGITDDMVRALVPSVARLSMLQLCGNRVTDEGLDVIAEHGAHLERLSLFKNEFTVRGLERLLDRLVVQRKTTSAPPCALRYLVLSRNGLDDSAMDAIVRAVQAPGNRLTELHLQNNAFSAPALERLYRALAHEHCALRELHTDDRDDMVGEMVRRCVVSRENVARVECFAESIPPTKLNADVIRVIGSFLVWDDPISPVLATWPRPGL